jgi:hypothetical protein
MTYQHGEAYCQMTYLADDGSGETETVWNSRDGVTPFVITLRSGKTAHHHDWSADQRMPEDWTPPSGMRIFTDLTRQRARMLAAAAVAHWLSDPETASHFRMVYGADEARAIAEMADANLRPGAPDLIDPDGQRT